MPKRECAWDDTEYEKSEIVEALKDIATALSKVRGNESSSISALRDFKSMNPPIFTGWSNSDPLRTYNWLRKIEKILDITNIQNDKMRVALAAFQLEGDADNWWVSASATRDIKAMTWGEFSDLFLYRYLPSSVRTLKTTEFYRLKQDEMSVMQYDAKFNELLPFASEEFRTDVKVKASHFVHGLRPGIKCQTAFFFGSHTYDEFVRKALLCETLEKNASSGVSESESSESDSRKRPRTIAKKTCYRCGQSGHIKSWCPN